MKRSTQSVVSVHMIALIAAVSMAPSLGQSPKLGIPLKLTLLFERPTSYRPQGNWREYRICTYSSGKVRLQRTIPAKSPAGWMQARLSPDGRHILALVAEHDSGPKTLSIVDVATGSVRQLISNGRAYRAAWSHSGRFVVVAYEEDESDVGILDRNGKRVIRASADSVVGVPGSDNYVIGRIVSHQKPYGRHYFLADPTRARVDALDNAGVDRLLGHAYRKAITLYEARHRESYRNVVDYQPLIEPRSRKVYISSVTPDSAQSMPDGSPAPNDSRWMPVEDAFVEPSGKMRLVHTESFSVFEPRLWTRDGRWVVCTEPHIFAVDSRTTKTYYENRFPKAYGELKDVVQPR